MCSCLREDEDENDDNNDNDDDDDLCPRVQLGAGSDCSAACPGQAAKSELKKTITMEHMCMHLHTLHTHVIFNLPELELHPFPHLR